ncbi:hypothetical protein FGO68_gene13872 [Halteria grandinella]|uniref:Casein kinase I n=1 Tax=Halteria grandinella TaxID=5974 RepID=A0A8J8NUV6_HALGN|nr:hypothetical protein FGO68_gene13872 [Halteria grandinella]
MQMDQAQSPQYPKEILIKGNKYLSIRELGRGAFGIAILYQNPITQEKVAVKALLPNSQQTNLSKEIFYMAKLDQQGLLHAPKYFGEGYHNKQSYIMMEYIEYSVEEYISQKASSLSEIGQQMLQALRELHENGFLHQDIKPDNFRVTSAGLVKLIDFGLLNEYKPNNRHKVKGRFGFQGSPYFGSTSSLDGYTLSRRDDLECLGYTLMHLAYGDCVNWSKMQNIREIAQAKKDFLKIKCSTSDLIHPFQKFISLAASLKFSEEPDYEKYAYSLNFLKSAEIEVEVILSTLEARVIHSLAQEQTFNAAKHFQEVESHRKQILGMKQEINETKREKSGLQEEVYLHKEEVSKLQQEKTELEAINEKLKKENSQLTKDNSSLILENQVLKENIVSQRKEVSTNTSEIMQVKDALAQLYEEQEKARLKGEQEFVEFERLKRENIIEIEGQKQQSMQFIEQIQKQQLEIEENERQLQQMKKIKEEFQLVNQPPQIAAVQDLPPSMPYNIRQIEFSFQSEKLDLYKDGSMLKFLSKKNKYEVIAVIITLTDQSKMSLPIQKKMIGDMNKLKVMLVRKASQIDKYTGSILLEKGKEYEIMAEVRLREKSNSKIEKIKPAYVLLTCENICNETIFNHQGGFYIIIS